MKKKIEISFAESAFQDLKDILHFYNEQKSPQVGEIFVAKIIKDIELLKLQPDMGRIVPEFELDYLKEFIRPSFRMVYHHNSNHVRIIRVWKSEKLMKLP